MTKYKVRFHSATLSPRKLGKIEGVYGDMPPLTLVELLRELFLYVVVPAFFSALIFTFFFMAMFVILRTVMSVV